MQSPQSVCSEGHQAARETQTLRNSLLTSCPCHSTAAQGRSPKQRKDGWKVEMKSAGMEKVCLVSSHDAFQKLNLPFALLSNLLLLPIFSQTFFGASSWFSFTAIKVHALHRCTGKENGCRGQTQAAKSIKNVWIDTACFNNPVKAIKTMRKYFCSTHTTKTRYYYVILLSQHFPTTENNKSR